jgi:hypothetical protein
MPKISKQGLKFVIYPIVGLIFINALGISLFLMEYQNQFDEFVSFGLNGTYNSFTIEHQATLSNGDIKTFSFINGPLLLFIWIILGNLFLSALYLRRLYKEKSLTSPH